MPDPWHGINDPGYWIKPQAAPADNTRTAVTDNETKPKEKAGPIATLSDAKFIPPKSGLKFNDKCPVQVSVKYREKSSQTRVTFRLFCNYKDKKQDLSKKVDANESNGVAKTELQLFYPEGYENGSVEYFFTAEHCRGDKVIESDKLTLPVKKGITDSVGQKGKNNPDDVKTVQQKLKDLGYPVKAANGTCDPETIKAIKFFQTFHKDIAKGLVAVDGTIDKGGKTEADLFGCSPKKYDPPKKGQPKPLQAGVEKKKTDAINGTDKDMKDKWQKIMDVWNEISPYLPAGTTMASGFRTKNEQREQLYDKYSTFQDKISLQFPDEDCQKNLKDSADKTLTEENRNKLDIKMHNQICKAVSSREVALPGTSKHESGKAIDTQTSPGEDRARTLLWYSIEFASIRTILNITKEDNSCVHFEFSS